MHHRLTPSLMAGGLCAAMILSLSAASSVDPGANGALLSQSNLAGPPNGAFSSQEVSFSEDVLPIFERSCTSCHGGVDENGNKRAEEDLDLSTYEGVMAGSSYGTVVEPGDADGSILVEMISAGDMPSQDDGPVEPLSAEEIEIIKTWINEGANNG